MSFLSILLTSFALSMDAFAVSVTKGMTLKNLTKKTAFKIATFFGLFQGGMPLIGWILGISFEQSIKSFDHWIALILLSCLGLKMIYEFIENKKNNSEYKIDIDSNIEKNETSDISNKELTMLSIATSIDALAIGISFAFLKVNILSASISIATITFLICLVGTLAGNKMGSIFKNYAELLGGIILILIGINIFNEHTDYISNLLINFI
ncbi:manganese efflux pump MntP [Romboutsia maritimum]|uniref:Putative manganese efflux pump MntP n=1 Tax=Romboutsia maritimum TaxID=2020948 RepID=A0A371IST0_9FIRM|nr:manganese efflux pump MntP family protein [Romboutsia maritimum]RDY23548.1 manganese efflux pump MntP [Romboutsia maritimum]